MPDRNREPYRIYPIQKVDVYDSVLKQLDRLVSGMEIGERLPAERKLAERLSVSRVSVREALRALESMGKVEIRRNAGSFALHVDGEAVTAQLKSLLPIDRQFLEHLVDVRAAVEDKVVALLAGKPNVDLSGTRELIERLEAELDDPEVELGSLDLRFEAVLGRLTGNPLLVELQRSVHQLWVEAWSKCRIAPGDRRHLHRQHVGILEALEAGDADLARQRMAEHVDRAVTGAEPIVGAEG